MWFEDGVVILVACGLQREASILRRDGIMPVIGGGYAAALEEALEDHIVRFPHISIIVSAGIAGALDPALKVGDTVIDLKPLPFRRGVGVGAIDDAQRFWKAPTPNPSPKGEGLTEKLPHAHHGKIIGQNHIAVTIAEKAALATTGALAVDMESHVAARVAERHGLPFIAIRTISDCAHETLPPAALVGMNPDGSMALGKVLASLARHPGQLPALIRTGRSAEKAFVALRQVALAVAALRDAHPSRPG